MVCGAAGRAHPTKDVPIHCNRRDCPECFKRWARREAIFCLRRLRAGAKYFSLKYGLRHVTLSRDGATLPDVLNTFRRERSAVYRVMERMRFLGGIAVFHAQRHHGADCWFDSPHWHVIGYGRVDADRRPTGWFVKTISKGEREARSWLGTLYYVLNHCAFARWTVKVYSDKIPDLSVDVDHTTEALTWFGGWAYNKLPSRLARRAGYNVARTDFCEICGSEMIPETTWNRYELDRGGPYGMGVFRRG